MLKSDSLCGDTMVSMFFFQAEDGIRDLVRSRGLGDVYKRQAEDLLTTDQINNLPADQVAVVCTGSQGEPTSALVLSLIHI